MIVRGKLLIHLHTGSASRVTGVGGQIREQGMHHGNLMGPGGRAGGMPPPVEFASLDRLGTQPELDLRDREFRLSQFKLSEILFTVSCSVEG